MEFLFLSNSRYLFFNSYFFLFRKCIKSELPGSKGAEGQEYINLLFELEKKLKDLSNEERKAQRQNGVTALLDAFWSWVEKTSEIPTTNEKLTKALNYAKNHKEGFQTFLEDGR